MEAKEVKGLMEAYASIYEGYGKGKKGKKKMHDCATHVEHSEYGQGLCIKEQHTMLEDGTVTHYDVEFGVGIVENVPVTELKILASEAHEHFDNYDKNAKVLDEKKVEPNEELPSGSTPRKKAERKMGQHGAAYMLRKREPGVGRNDQAADSHLNRGHTIHNVIQAMDAGEEPHKDPKWKNTIAARRRERASYEVPNERPGGLRARETSAATEDDQGRVRSHRRVKRRNGDGGESENTAESYDLFDYILEHLVAEGYADTNKAALAIMANMSEEWREDIVEAAADQSDKQIERGIKTTHKAGNVLDNQHQGRSSGLSRLPAGEREEKTKRMRKRLKARRDDLFGERRNREDAAREEMKKKYGL